MYILLCFVESDDEKRLAGCARLCWESTSLPLCYTQGRQDGRGHVEVRGQYWVEGEDATWIVSNSKQKLE